MTAYTTPGTATASVRIMSVFQQARHVLATGKVSVPQRGQRVARSSARPSGSGRQESGSSRRAGGSVVGPADAVRHGFGHTRQVSSSSDIQGPADGLAPAAEPPAAALQLSELEVALLALLSIRPMTGYEILRHHARALEPWWETPRTQIYPKLRELQRRGLIEHEYVVQESKPNKRLYSIGPTGAQALASWLGSSINAPEMRHHMMMRLFLGNLLPIEETSRLLADYRDKMAGRAESFRQARERFSRSLSGPYRASVFFELLSLDHLIAMTDLEVAGTDKALAALRRFGSDGALASGEQASELLDAIRDVS